MIILKNFFVFLKRNFFQLKKYGVRVIVNKSITLIKIFLSLPIYFLLTPILLILYLIRPFFLVRFQLLPSNRIGHFTLNTELYCCERDSGINNPQKPYLDLFCFSDICNQQLAKMWKRELNILPAWLLRPLFNMNGFFSKFFSSCTIHKAEPAHIDRDIHNLLMKSKPHISFTSEEKALGKRLLEQFGLSTNSKFICLIVRDDAYLNNYLYKNWGYHSYRNGEIDNFVLAAEEITKKGYFVFRMGKKVKKPMVTSNPMIIDYAHSSMKNDFMDIYLGANCTFCLSTGVGFDGIPAIFRKPIALILSPMEDFPIYEEKSLVITKNHFLKKEGRNLKLSEISAFNLGRAYRTDQYEKKGIELIHNTPEEIRDLALEMIDKLEGNWKTSVADNELQKKFWNIYSSFFNFNLHKSNRVSNRLNGKIKIKIGTKFLKENKHFLE